MSIALVLGGGAPNLTLMAGALAALDSKKVDFEIVSALGAGMLVALLYATEKDRRKRRKALRRTLELGVADSIHRFVPVNYKVFQAPGPAAQLYRSWTRFLQDSMGLPKDDWTQLMLASFSPSNLSSSSLGLCEPAPWIEDWVDFRKVPGFAGKLYLSAYCLEQGRMEMFPKGRITAEVFRACLALPFLYPPVRIDKQTYIEGSAYDTFNFRGLLDEKKERPNLLVVFDVLSKNELLQPPRNLLDAWVMSIMTPLVAMAQDDLKLYCLEHAHKYRTQMLLVPFDIPKGHWRNVLDWSSSNLLTLYKIGYRSGLKFYRKYRRELDAKTWSWPRAPAAEEVLGLLRRP